MAELLALALAFPTVVFTVLLGVVLVYWLFVVLGALHVDVLGAGHEGALEGGALEGGTLEGGSLEGAAKGVAEGGADHLGLDVAEDAGITGFVESMRLRSAPATVVLSLWITFSWLVSVLAVQTARDVIPSVPAWLVGIVVLVIAPAVALPVTSLAVRPLAKLFVPHVAKGRADLVGKVCVIRTGSVDDAFGEATLEDGGAGLVVRVRVEPGEALKRGDQALIVGWDADRQAFTVAAMDEILAEREDAKRGKRG
jgi:hypothetical protein